MRLIKSRCLSKKLVLLLINLILGWKVMSHEDKVKKGAESIEGTSGAIGASGVDGDKVKKDIESIAGTLCPEGALGASRQRRYRRS